MSRSLIAGLLAFGLLACGSAESNNLADAGGGSKASSAATATSQSLAVGSTIGVTIQDAISSRTNKAGEHINGVTTGDVLTEAGLVAIPSGSPVVLTISKIGAALNSGQKDGVIELDGTSVTVNGTTYDLGASVGAVPHTLKGRGVTKSAVGNVAVGTAIGALVGQAIGKNQKSTIIGGAVGAVAGGARAATIADRDVIVAPGTSITLTLTHALKISAN